MSSSSSRSDDGPSFPVVGIGASAGGLEAVKTFLEGLPADPEMAFVLVMHLSPDRESHLGELLTTSTEMPVTTVSEAVDLEAGRLYVIQPETDLELREGDRLVAEPRSEREVPAHPIDRLFRSLASEVGERAVAVVLSGSGSDGAQGVREINRQNGLVLVQEPEEAGFRSMPDAAIGGINPDLVLSAEELGERLAELIAAGPKRQLLEKDDELRGEDEQAFRWLLERIRKETGHDLRSYKRPTLLRRISRRIQVVGASTLEEYRAVITDRLEELERLYQDLLIPVTSFFRDPAVFARLESAVIPELFAEKGPEDRVRVWVPACSTGEEAYTYAILLSEEARGRAEAPTIQLFATDISTPAIERARTGRYPETIAEDVDERLLDRYFSKREDNGYVVQPRIRDQIVFAEHDLLADPPFAQLDLISCRNLLIYLQPEAQQRVLEIAHFALRPGGYILLGSAESAETKSDLFRAESRDLGIYRRRDMQRGPMEFAGWAGTATQGGPSRTPLDKRADSNFDPAAAHQQLRSAALGAPSVLVDGSYRVLHLSAGADRYLSLAEGQLPKTILDLATGRLQTALRTALFTADREKAETVRRRIPVEASEEESENAERRVTVRVRPLQGEEHELFHVLLEPELETGSKAGEESHPGEDQQTTDTVRQLEKELKETRRQLRAATEEYESANEELRASNEELISMNEELQSTSEELETRKEELESMNEEMQTVNEELTEKVEALHEAYGDLENLMAATQIPTLFLNRDLEIRRFTPTTSELFNIRPADKGRPIGDLTTRLEYGQLEADSRAAFREERVIEREITCADGRWYLVRVRPYYTVSEEVEGTVLSFVDITDRKEARRELEALNETLEERVRGRTRELEEEITERKRLEREILRSADEDRYLLGQSLHDGIGQELSGIRMMSRSLSNNLEEMDLSEQAGKARQIEAAITEADEHARQLAQQIVPVDLGEGGLEKALGRFERDMAELHGLRVELETEGLEAIPPEIGTQLFRITQEAALNATVHGEAETLTVRIEHGDEEILLQIDDDGTGLPAKMSELQEEGMGLRLMQYRAHLHGGTFEIASREGGGTRVQCRFPFLSA